MSANQETANQIQEAANEIRQQRLERMGLRDQYNLWRESVPGLQEGEAYDTFLNAQQVEQGALDGDVSAVSGGAPVDTATTPPTPGPDAEGPGTDGPGDTSEGGDAGPGDGELEIEGLWMPPEESQAINFEYPPMAEFTASSNQDWMDNARVVHEFAGSPNNSAPPKTPGYHDIAIEPEEMGDEQIAQWAKEQMSLFNWNTGSTLQWAHRITTSGDVEAAKSFLNLLNMYDYGDAGADEFGRASGALLMDPTTWLGFGVGTAAARGAARALAKKQLSNMIKGAVVAGAAGAVEGGALSGGFDLARQNIEQEAGTRENIDVGQAAIATGVGIAGGAALAAPLGALIGRQMDRLGAEVERQMTLQAGGMAEEDRRLAANADAREMIRLMRQNAEYRLRVDEGDVQARLTNEWMADPANLARHMNKDGSVDTAGVNREIDELLGYADKEMSDADVNNALREVTEAAEELQQETRAKNRVRDQRDEELTGALSGEGTHGPEVLETVDALERAGIRTLLGEQNDVLFDSSGMSQANSERIQRAVDAVEGVEAVGDAYPNPPGYPDDIGEYIVLRGSDEGIAEVGRRIIDDLEPARLPSEESRIFAERIGEMHATLQEEVVPRTATMPGSRVQNVDGVEFEVMGRTENGWFQLRNRRTGDEVNLRKSQFEVIEAHPAPDAAGPMNLDPFTTSAARIMAMNEQVVSGKLERVTTTTPEQYAIIEELQAMGVRVTDKNLATHWTPAELLWLRDTYNAQANGIAGMARQLESKLRNEGRLTNEDLARFNDAHTQFVATRDLFFGVSGNAARQLQILRTRPTDQVYEFSQSLLDSISLQGGRANTERAITLMADFGRGQATSGKSTAQRVSEISTSIWGVQWKAAVLNARYNLMLSSWRTHFFNFTGNSLAAAWQHGIISPIRMGINNAAYARDLARSVIQPQYRPDPADRITRSQIAAEWRGHIEGFRDSLFLAKEIALGRDIGEGKIWNELGLRYNVVNVPNSVPGRLGTTPVRLLEAGDAFFKNQAYQSKLHELASVRARTEQIHQGLDYQTQYRHWVDNPDAPMQRAATEFGQKQTFTNDPNVYGGLLANVAEAAAALQNRNMIVNMIVPFVRTPANLMMYSMEAIGGQQALTPGKTWAAISRGTQRESQEAQARLTAAAGLWLITYSQYQDGNVTGAGPANWEERQVWEAAGWQANSVRLGGKWYGVDRLDPLGMSLNTMASVFDFYALSQQENRDPPAFIGAGLLHTADMMLDESYLSTATDMLAAIRSKQTTQSQSVIASMVNSMLVPNLLRDLRRPADATMRSSSSPNLLSQMLKQMQNANPWGWGIDIPASEQLPPQRDWKGEPKNYWGNAYQRALIPFAIRDPSKADRASMALAYARVPVSTPDRTISIPRTGDSFSLFAMDNGRGFVYDKYLEIVGQRRNEAVQAFIESPFYAGAVQNNAMGPGTEVDGGLRQALAIGTRAGRLEMLGFLIEHHGDNSFFERGNGDLIQIQHPVSVDEYIRYREIIRGGDPEVEAPEQYDIEAPAEGPQFFSP